GTGPAVVEKHAGAGRAALPEPRDGGQGVLDAPAGVQPDPGGDGPGGAGPGVRAAGAELRRRLAGGARVRGAAAGGPRGTGRAAARVAAARGGLSPSRRPPGSGRTAGTETA